MTRKRIAIINTGGTISMSEDRATGKVSPSSHNPLTQDSTLFGEYADLTVHDLFHLPSPHVRLADMLALSQWIQQHANDYDGMVITHGTDTLEETAYFLDLTLALDLPIVLTGAMRSSNEIGADGLANLRSALITALADASYRQGVLVVMNDEIHTATYVTKTHTTNLATFQTPTFGPIGLVTKNQVIYFQQRQRQAHYPITQLTQRVALLKAYADMEPDLFASVLQADYAGVVIEGLGAGNMPPATVPIIEQLIEKGVVVVMVSRAFNGITEDVYDYVGGGKQLHQVGVIYTQGLSGVKARLKLIALLNSDTSVDLAQAFKIN